MLDEPPELSRSVEDYLKAIYSLSQSGSAASTSDIAEALDVQPASVSGMIKRLAEYGYVEHLRYRGVRLSAAGTREALRIIRRHRVLETYLARRLGYSWDVVHEEAEHLEHAASDELIDRMAASLEDPSHDPHGSPIPTRGGDVEVTDHPALAELPVGTRAFIRWVGDDDPERLRYMEARGLLPGVLVEVVRRAPFDGPITLRLKDGEVKTHTIGHELASGIRVAVQEG